MNKIFIYIVIMPLCIYAMDSLDINVIFKRGKEIQSKVLYILMVLGLCYLIVNMIWDLFY